MSRIIIFLLFFLSYNKSFTQGYKQQTLYAEITAYNDSNQYEKSILRLEEVISNPKASLHDLYNAYFLKYLTYKRLFNYSEALNNLDLALEVGLKCDENDDMVKRDRIERMFIHFDLLEFDKVSELLITISRKDFKNLEKESEAFYLSVLGTMSIRTKNYQQAEEYLNEALAVLLAHNPKHLPLIYRKKIGLHLAQKQYNEALKNFEKGLFYAEKYKIEIYKIAMYNDISSFYSEIGDIENALRTQHILNKLAKDYDNTNRSGKLNILEKKILYEKKAQTEKKAANTLYFFTGLSFVLIILIIVVFYFYRKHKHKRIQTEIEINEIQHVLNKVTLEINEQNTPKIDFTTYDLTERQLNIIKLVKDGKTNKEIGMELFISENTVKYHLKIIYETLKINKRSEL